jgi:hypothetical protein
LAGGNHHIKHNKSEGKGGRSSAGFWWPSTWQAAILGVCLGLGIWNPLVGGRPASGLLTQILSGYGYSPHRRILFGTSAAPVRLLTKPRWPAPKMLAHEFSFEIAQGRKSGAAPLPPESRGINQSHGTTLPLHPLLSPIRARLRRCCSGEMSTNGVKLNGYVHSRPHFCFLRPLDV